MTTPKIMILGGGYAGLLMAFRVAGKIGKQAEITLIDAKPYFVERIRLHQLATQQSVPQRAYSDWLKGKAIRFVQGRVTTIQPDGNTLTVQSATGEQHLMYDYLAYALGSMSDKSSVPGVAEYAYTVGVEQEAIKLRKQLAAVAQGGGNVVVVGGGLTGIETITELAEKYPTLSYRLVTNGKMGSTLSRKGQAYLHDVMERLNITVTENVSVQEVNADSIVTDNDTFPADVCIWSGAFRVSPLAKESGIQVNPSGQIVVDGSLRSISHPNIYAIGDAADVNHAITTPIRMACATAMPMGAYAGKHLVANVQRERLPDPFRFAYAAQCISLGRKAALVQFVDENDQPLERMMTGRAGAMMKETICRYTVFGLNLERYFPGSFVYPQSSQPKSALQTMSAIE
jgi:NADH dehydrogenase